MRDSDVVIRVLIVVSTAMRRGAEIEAVAVAAALRSRGIDVHVAALHKGSERSLDIEILGTSPLSPLTLAALRRRSSGVDLVVAWGSRTITACALALHRRTPWVYRSIGEPKAWVRGPLHRVLTGIQFRRATCVVALWDGAKHQISSLYNVDSSRLRVIPNGRDVATFTPVLTHERLEIRRSLGLAEDGNLAIILGALSPEKHPRLAIDACMTVPGCRAIVAGDGPLRGELERYLADNNNFDGRVSLVGAFNDPRPLLAASDVLVISSVTEGMPGAAIEALLSGVSVASVPVGAIPSMLSGIPSAAIAKARDATHLAAAIESALASTPSDRALSRQAVAVSFGLGRIAEDWASLIRALAHSKTQENPR